MTDHERQRCGLKLQCARQDAELKRLRKQAAKLKAENDELHLLVERYRAQRVQLVGGVH